MELWARRNDDDGNVGRGRTQRDHVSTTSDLGFIYLDKKRRSSDPVLKNHFH